MLFALHAQPSQEKSLKFIFSPRFPAPVGDVQVLPLTSKLGGDKPERSEQRGGEKTQQNKQTTRFKRRHQFSSPKPRSGSARARKSGRINSEKTHQITAKKPNFSPNDGGGRETRRVTAEKNLSESIKKRKTVF